MVLADVLFYLCQCRAGRGMKLGGKAKTNDFVEALMAEGERVAPENEPAAAMAQTHHQSSSSSLPVTDHERFARIGRSLRPTLYPFISLSLSLPTDDFLF